MEVGTEHRITLQYTDVRSIFVQSIVPRIRIAPTMPHVNTRPWCSKGT